MTTEQFKKFVMLKYTCGLFYILTFTLYFCKIILFVLCIIYWKFIINFDPNLFIQFKLSLKSNLNQFPCYLTFILVLIYCKKDWNNFIVIHFILWLWYNRMQITNIIRIPTIVIKLLVYTNIIIWNWVLVLHGCRMVSILSVGVKEANLNAGIQKTGKA